MAIAVAQEEKSLKDSGKIYKKFKPSPKFALVADIGRKQTERYDRVTVYLIDKQGKIAQIFEAMTHFRPPWDAVLAELRALEARQNATATADR